MIKKWVNSYVTNPELIAKHPFLPFIHITIIKRKYRRTIDEFGKSSGLRSKSLKKREIYYANHLDSNIYSYYALKLSEKYEQIIKERKIDKSITAYRRIPLCPINKKVRNKCNVDFANEIFEFIRENKENNLVAITFDIKNFFNNLDHKILKRQWCKVLDVRTLDEANYNIFRNITKFSYIEEYEIFNEFKNEIIVEN